MINVNQTDGVAVVELAHGKVNAIDVELLSEIDSTLDAISSDPGVSAMVLTGSGPAFSAGVDLRRVIAEGPEYMGKLISGLQRSLEALFMFAKPAVAAINGPAVAGGCVIACACDRRIASQTAMIGASELVVGVSFPASALEIMRAASADHIDEIVFGGGIFEPERAIELGLVDEVVVPERVVGRAVEVAAKLATIQPDAFGLAKEQLRRPALELMRSGAALIDDRVIDQWSMPDTRRRIADQLDRLKKT
jgi:enoyl-CoA hydratase